jgi:hypothetical protein
MKIFIRILFKICRFWWRFLLETLEIWRKITIFYLKRLKDRDTIYKSREEGEKKKEKKEEERRIGHERTTIASTSTWAELGDMSRQEESNDIEDNHYKIIACSTHNRV